MHLPSHIRYELWNKGKPLNEVFKKVKIENTKSLPDTDSNDSFWHRVGKAVDYLTENTIPTNNMLMLAEKGTNIWLGLLSPNGVHDAPVIIPITHIKQVRKSFFGSSDDIDITKKQDEKEYLIASYVQVRVIKRETLIKAQQEYASSQDKAPIAPMFKKQTGKAGRPSVKSYLVEAFDALVADGMIDSNGSFRSHCPLIRSWLVNAYPEDSARLGNLADETMRKVLAPLFYEL